MNIDTQLLENEHVKEFLALMEQSNSPSKQDFLDVLRQVGKMEGQLQAAVDELAAMRRELAEAREQSHPVRTAMQNAVKTTEKNVTALRERLSELKQNIIDGCKSAVDAFKEKGVAVLDNLAQFFNIRGGLEALGRTLDKAIQNDDKAIAKIEAMSAEYHEAGRHLKNVGRALLGREAIAEAKSPGKIAEALEGPYRRERNALSSMRKGVNKALSGVERLEQAARPSISQALQDMTEKVQQQEQPMRVSVRKVSRDER